LTHRDISSRSFAVVHKNVGLGGIASMALPGGGSAGGRK